MPTQGVGLLDMQYMFAYLYICWFRVRLLWVQEIAIDCSRHDGWNHPIECNWPLV